jgi:hypothetical protein
MADQQLDNPAYQCPDYKAQQYDWQLVNDVYKGTNGVQQTGRTAGITFGGYASIYLPREPAESEKAHQVRVRRSVFWNAFKRTVQGLTGMVFRKNPQLGEDVPEQIATLTENIDLEGNHLETFSKDVFKTALTDGHAFILVDMPESEVTDAATLADEQQAGLRPYWCKVNKNQVVNWHAVNRNGRMELTQVSIREEVTEPAGVYRQKQITQYRVLTPGAFQIFRQSSIQPDQYELFKEGTTSLDFIPLIPVYSNRTAYLMSDPPLLDFARENLRHYRLQSDLDHILHVANVPILTAIGRDLQTQIGPDGSTTKLEIGPNSLVDLPPGGDLKYVEHAGTAIDKAQAEIERSKGNMAALGLLLLAQKPQVQATATQSVLEYEAESSELAGMARNLEDALETALAYTGEYLGLGEDQGGTVAVNRDFARTSLNAQTIDTIAKMVEDGQLTLETMWKMLEEGEILPEDFDPEEEKAALEESTQAHLDAATINALANMVAADELPLETFWSLLIQAKLLPADFNEAKAKAMIEAEISKRQTYPALPVRGPLKSSSQPLDKPGEPPMDTPAVQ